MKIKNVDIPKENFTHLLQKDQNGRLRNQLIRFNVSGKTWEQKKDLIEKELLYIYKDIPDGVHFRKRKARTNKHNPDGQRIFIFCDWIKRNRFYDVNGIFHFGTLIKAINNQIQGKTKTNILKRKVNKNAKHKRNRKNN